MKEIFDTYLMPFFSAIIGGVISSGLWWLMTRIICFPTFTVSKSIKDSGQGKKIIEIKNINSRYGGYSIECYGEYKFLYKGRPVKYPIKPKYIYYLPAGDTEEISVKIPHIVKLDDNITLEDAFYQSQDGTLEIRLVYQNLFGIKRSFTPCNPVQKEEYPYNDPIEENL